MPWFCYILECEGGSLYTGVTNNPDKRFEKHLKGEAAKYTRANRPERVVWLREFGDKSTAMKREAEIKGWGRSKKKKLAADFEAIDIRNFI